LSTNAVSVIYANTAQLDAFGRVRVSNPVVIFDSNFRYDVQSIIWDEATTGSGTQTYVGNQSTILLSIGTNVGSVIRQSKPYFQYVPGKSQLILLTGRMPEVTGITARIGYFDANNGLFFEQTAAGISINVRTYSSGAPVTTSIIQANWNVDVFNGSQGSQNPSGYQLDLSKCQIYAIDFEWLAVGRVRFGFVLGGVFYVAHEVNNSNNIATVYMQTAKLPVRYEISSTGTTAGAQMQQICASVMSEGGTTPPKPLIFVADTGSSSAVSISAASYGHLLSIRLQSRYNRATLQPISYAALVTGSSGTGGGNFYYQILLNPTLTGAGVSWTAIPNTYAEKCVGTTNVSVTGGYQLDTGFVSNSATNAVQSLENSYLGINSNIVGTSDILTLYIYNLSTGGGASTNFYGWIQFAQLFSSYCCF
jgi:hypothetical protein